MKIQKKMMVASIIAAALVMSLMTVPALAVEPKPILTWYSGCTLLGPARLVFADFECDPDKYVFFDLQCVDGELEGPIEVVCEWGFMTIIRGIDENDKGNVLIFVFGNMVIALLPSPNILFFGSLDAPQ